MNYRNARPLDVENMWAHLQAFADHAQSRAEEAARNSLDIGVSFAAFENAEWPGSVPIGVVRYLLTTRVKPSAEVLASLPDDLFLAC
jgi:hypothetical protein